MSKFIRPGMTTHCLEWQASRNGDGYGHFKLRGKARRSHRVAWEITYGTIPDGLCVIHRCDNPRCVAIEHLCLGTPMENVRDCLAKGRQVAGISAGASNGTKTHPECVARGEANGRAKITENNVITMFNLHAYGWTRTMIAEKFDVSRVLVGKVLSRKIWAHVELEQLYAR
jgi:hypothetical protein